MWGARVWREGAHQPAAAVGKKVKFLRRAGAHGTAHCRRTDQDTAAANLCHSSFSTKPTLTVVGLLHAVAVSNLGGLGNSSAYEKM